MIAIEPLACADPLGLPGLESELQHRFLVWDAWTAGKRRVDLHPFVLAEADHRRAIATATAAWELVAGAADRAAADPTERALYKLHPDVERLAAAARHAGDRTSVVRVDLLLRTDGTWVACEVNADCPGGYNETLALPLLSRRAGARRALRDPTDVATRLADHLVAVSGGPGSPKGLVALAYATGYSEDLQVCAILEKLVRERGGRTVRLAPTQLSACGAGVGHRGEPIAVMYRFYPLESLPGQKNLDAIVRATAFGALASLSSFAVIHAQSKLAMARADANTIFPDTHAFAAIGRARLLAERARWVVKRDLSRVGDHVFVGALLGDEEWAEILLEIEAAERDLAAVWIAQAFVPQHPLPTPWGDRLVTLGAYLIVDERAAQFAGYFTRISPTSHCSHDALVLPTFILEADT